MILWLESSVELLFLEWFDDVRMSLMLRRSCRCRQDNAGAILNLTIRVQLPCQFPIGPSFLHKDDGITLVNQDRTTLFSVSGNAIKREEKVTWENRRHFATPLTVSPRNDVWETSAEIPLLMTRHHPRSWQWRVISMEFLRSFLRPHFAWKPLVASRNGVCVPRLRRKTFLRPQAWLDL